MKALSNRVEKFNVINGIAQVNAKVSIGKIAPGKLSKATITGRRLFESKEVKK